MIRTAGVAAMVLLLLTTASASVATTKTVKMANYAFKPANLSARSAPDCAVRATTSRPAGALWRLTLCREGVLAY